MDSLFPLILNFNSMHLHYFLYFYFCYFSCPRLAFTPKNEGEKPRRENMKTNL